MNNLNRQIKKLENKIENAMISEIKRLGTLADYYTIELDAKYYDLFDKTKYAKSDRYGCIYDEENDVIYIDYLLNT